MAKYRKKPVVIEAIRRTGNNEKEIIDFVSNGTYYINRDGGDAIIRTLEGDMIASVGDYIIKGVNGEFYPCKPNIFHKTYEEVK